MKKFSAVILVILILISGCAKNDSTFSYESIDKEWSIEIPNQYKKDKEEVEDDFYHISYRDEEGGIFSITEVVDRDKVLNEESIEAELKGDSYFHMERKEVLDIEGIGKVYGGLIEDHATRGYMLYYKLRINDRIISLLTHKKQPFTLGEEGRVKSMIGNIKILK